MAFSRILSFTPSSSSSTLCCIIENSKHQTRFMRGSSQTSYLSLAPTNLQLSAAAAFRSPKGFGSALKKNNSKKKKNNEPKRLNEENDDYDDDEEEEEEEEDEEDVIPEVITNRMMNRVGISVGVPLFIGLLFFPFFYYLKVVVKLDIPTWIPFIVSFFFFGSALLGISYGIVSSSWDPMREGSLLGWNEAVRNWPVFWRSLRGRGIRSVNK
ncbi:hypothetical protein MKW94_015958 [Papaver nudicaule]|uniref:Protein PAM68, chloroplastic n=1 Tax=Papaver nudicaule TaxID=74823 RepID=A0AA41SD50_PAPNU|nr:hypothetical protein [Papaver nudicaule]